MKKIAPFKKGDKRTMLSAKIVNQFVEILNAIVGIKGINGIKISLSQGNVVVELSDAALKQLGLTPELDGTPGGGTLKWRGEWSETEEYEINDIVIYKSATSIDSGIKAGTYIALVPNSGVEPFETSRDATVTSAQTTWQTLAKSAFEKLVILKPSTGIAITLDGETGTISGFSLEVESIDADGPCDLGAAAAADVVLAGSDLRLNADAVEAPIVGSKGVMLLNYLGIPIGKTVAFRTVNFPIWDSLSGQVTGVESRLVPCSETL